MLKTTEMYWLMLYNKIFIIIIILEHINDTLSYTCTVSTGNALFTKYKLKKISKFYPASSMTW